MKKLFFTAIAMVAFSSVSMASNAVEIEKPELLEENNNAAQKNPRHEFCVNVAADVLEMIDPNNEMGDVEAHDTYQIAYNICMGF